MNHWEIITDNLKKAGWRFGCISSTDQRVENFGSWRRLRARVRRTDLGFAAPLLPFAVIDLLLAGIWGLRPIYIFVIAVWRAKVGNRIAKATAKEIECPLLNRRLVANYPRLCWFP